MTGRWFSPVSSTNQTERHDKTEILLKVALNTINQAKPYCDVHTVYGSPSNWHFTYVFILCIIYNCRCIYRKLQNCCFYFVCEVTVSRIQQVKCKVRDMVFNATLNIISIIISWRSVLLVGETAVSGESHTVVSSTTIRTRP